MISPAPIPTRFKSPTKTGITKRRNWLVASIDFPGRPYSLRSRFYLQSQTVQQLKDQFNGAFAPVQLEPPVCNCVERPFAAGWVDPLGKPPFEIVQLQQ